MANNKQLTIPVPLQPKGAERRTAERIQAEMPITIAGHEGTTSDLSVNGLSFVADRPYEIGSCVDVVIEYLLDGHNYPLHCQAEVVRVRPTAQGYAVGARLTPQSQAQLEVPAADGKGRAP